MDSTSITSIAHELGNLLQIISGGTQSAGHGGSDHTIPIDCSHEIDAAITRASLLIQRLASLTHSGSDLQTTSAEAFSPIIVQGTQGGIAPRADTNTHTCRGTVLIADDDPISSSISAEYLQDAGYSTVVAQNGREAIRLFHEHSNAIVLLLFDFDMQPGNGKEAYQSIQAVRRDVPIVMCSGYDARHVFAGISTSYGCSLQKPYTRAQLLQAIIHVIEVAADTERSHHDSRTCSHTASR